MVKHLSEFVSMKPCTDQESFVRGGPTSFTTFFFWVDVGGRILILL